MSEIDILAHILQGEAGICPLMALVAVAYAYAEGRAGPFYGWQIPSPLAVWVALMYTLYPDPTPSARYFFSRQDLRKPAVQRLIGRDPPLAVWECAGGLALYAY